MDKLMSQQPQKGSRDFFREGLSANEKPIYDLFCVREGRKPDCFWELMCWSAQMQSLPSLSESILGFKL